MYDKSDITFIAIDFETATSKRASICEVGICVVRNGEIVETRSWLVRPEDNYYQYWNIKVHGIRPQDTENAPIMYLSTEVAYCHRQSSTAFIFPS